LNTHPFWTISKTQIQSNLAQQLEQQSINLEITSAATTSSGATVKTNNNENAESGQLKNIRESEHKSKQNVGRTKEGRRTPPLISTMGNLLLAERKKKTQQQQHNLRKQKKSSCQLVQTSKNSEFSG